jgi:hypothetical protein
MDTSAISARGEGIRPWSGKLRQAIVEAKHGTARVLWSARGPSLVAVVALCTALPALAAERGIHTRRAAAEDREHLAEVVVRFYDVDVARHLFQCPRSLETMVILALCFTPIVTLLLAYDSGLWREGDGIRFTAARASRGVLVVSRAATAWATFCVIALAVYAPVGLYEGATGLSPLSTVVTYTALFFGATCCVAAAYVPLWTLVSSAVRSTKMSLALGGLLMLLLAAAHTFVHAKLPDSRWAQILPGSLDQLLLSGRPDRMMAALTLTGGWVVTMLGAASRLSKRRDLA